ncbi:MAG: PKD domain-containing protein [Flavobacteriales bacterium]|nr:PKD domain-containing protein [Flavobacteriales bacterium]
MKKMIASLIVGVFSLMTYAQQNQNVLPAFKGILKGEGKTQEHQYLGLEKVFKTYQVYQLDVPSISALSRKTPTGNLTFNLQLETHTWELHLHVHDIRAASYEMKVNTGHGVITMPSTPAFTYRGYEGDTPGNHVVMTIREHYIAGYIQQEDDTYYIEPLQHFEVTAPANEFVVYKMTDVLAGEKAICTQSRDSKPDVAEYIPAGRTSAATKCTEMAVAYDQSFKSRIGSTTAAETEITARLNLVSDFWEQEFNVEYKLTLIYECTSNEFIADSNTESCQEGSGNPSCAKGTVLREFRDWGENIVNPGNAFAATQKDVATFWTDRNIKDGSNTGNIGYSMFAGICNSSGYNIVEDYFTTGQNAHASIWIHELGHTWNAIHVQDNAQYMMSPSIYGNNSTAPTNRTVTSGTRSRIEAHRDSRSCLDEGCTVNVPPVADFETINKNKCTGVVSFGDQSTNSPNQWLWDFGDGQTSSSQNPTHTYASSGTYTVKLTATNSIGSDSETKAAYITISLLKNAPSTADLILCPSEAPELTATGNYGGNLVWYDSNTGGNVVGTGSPVTINPRPTVTTTYYVEEQSAGGVPDNVGMVNNAVSNNGGYYSTTEEGLVFDALKDITLKSVKVYVNIGGNKTFKLTTSGGTVLETFTGPIAAGEHRVNLNWNISAGTGYKLLAAANNDLYREKGTGITYPYSDGSGYVSITCNTYDANDCNGFYYYFYDWEVSGQSCSSPRATATIEVKSDQDPECTSTGDNNPGHSTALPAMWLFPNPTDGAFRVEVSNIQGTVDIEVFNVLGKKVYETNSRVDGDGVFPIYLNENPGLYFIRVSSGESRLISPVMIK